MALLGAQDAIGARRIMSIRFRWLGAVLAALWICSGAQAQNVPADYFGDLRLATPLPTELRTGQVFSLRGTIDDPAITGDLICLQRSHRGRHPRI